MVFSLKYYRLCAVSNSIHVTITNYICGNIHKTYQQCNFCVITHRTYEHDLKMYTATKTSSRVCRVLKNTHGGICVFFFLRQGLTYPRLAYDLLCSWGRTWAADIPACISQVWDYRREQIVLLILVLGGEPSVLCMPSKPSTVIHPQSLDFLSWRGRQKYLTFLSLKKKKPASWGHMDLPQTSSVQADR